MTTVYAERSGRHCCLLAWGHATGSEAACAAVSGILYALAGYLANAERDSRAKVHARKLESGKALMEFTGDEGATAAFEMAVIGLMQIAQAQPERVRVAVKEKD